MDIRVPPLLLGLLAGLIFGLLAVASMIKPTFPDKRAALLGAFVNRLTIGLVLGAVIGAPQVTALGWPGWAIGLAVGIGLSLADAIITKAYAPVLIFGAIGGSLIGWVVERFGR